MGKPELLHHYINEQPNIDCSTLALHSILPHLPEPESTKALYDNTLCLEDILKVLSYEFCRRGEHVRAFAMEDYDNPARFFYDAAHTVRHGTDNAVFRGGLLLTDEEQTRHVISITNVHESKKPKFDIVDSAPHNTSKLTYRTVAGNFLNRRVIQNSSYGVSAIAIVGYDLVPYLEKPELYPEIYSTFQSNYQVANDNRDLLLSRVGKLSEFINGLQL